MTALRFKMSKLNAVTLKRLSKSFFLVLVALISCLTISLSGCTTKPVDPEWRVVSSTFVDVKTGPGRGYPITTSILEGERIQILYQRMGYTKIRTPENIEGWIETKTLPDPKSATKAPAKP